MRLRWKKEVFMRKNVDIVENINGNKVVVIHDILFKGKQSIKWSDVEEYLKKYIKESYLIKSTADMVYIGKDLPDEYAHSKYTNILKGANAKAKANAVQGIPEILEIADEKEYEENNKEKHSKDAKYGWYSYVTRFALPIYRDNNTIERYNIYRAVVLVRHAEDDRLYLYDIIKIKKETSTLFKY